MKVALYLLVFVASFPTFAASYVCRGKAESIDGVRYAEVNATVRINEKTFWYSVEKKTVPPFKPHVWKWEAPHELVYKKEYSQDTGELVRFIAVISGRVDEERYSLLPIRDGSTVISYNSSYDCGDRGPMTCDGPWERFELFDCRESTQ